MKYQLSCLEFSSTRMLTEAQSQAQHLISRPLHPDLANMNPIASTFVPSDSSQTQHGNEPEVLALIRALTAEQQAHEAAQASLQTACARLVEVENQLRKLENQNKSLTSTVNMLKSIIKNQQSKIQETSSSLNKSSSEAIAAGAKSKEPELSNCILYDVVAKQRAEYHNDKASDSSENVKSSHSGLWKNSDSQLSYDRLFDLNLLKNTGSEGSQFSNSSRSFPREFRQESSDKQPSVNPAGGSNKDHEKQLMSLSTSSRDSSSTGDRDDHPQLNDERLWTKLIPPANRDATKVQKQAHEMSTLEKTMPYEVCTFD